uniref:RRM domain-containing protein n=1 Tax=Chromera velia CCMP2878 TaxID=1169474 RepID=A0A0G4G7T6_9ALVE|eukprot:Cvel_20651.t1-p1 / transcript=Cvel_20651.t1 / gene=Cvel_20651 / organism=Chromera_velia_CCMP2878 / gene_product=RNA-binding protein Musashi homolog 1, putative / transcript_product=RNA-binding protein Musashi homolog 1, putative / location=Cvel_scaffold1874:2206-5289(-) / protein_length=401 / sequence_SO=supercontig / SO=protein_coding / is_pseudo=false
MGYPGPRHVAKPFADRRTLDDQQKNPRKIFIGNLQVTTSEKNLTVYFSQFGALEDCVVVIDKRTGQSRGFGFIIFQQESSVENVMAKSVHRIDGVVADVRRAVPRDEARQEPPPDTIPQPEKLFVGGLGDDVTEDDLRRTFSPYGTVKEVVIMCDKLTRRPRGFAFVIFTTEEAANSAVGTHQIKGRMCETKKAEPNRIGDVPRVPREMRGGGPGGPYRGGRGGRGGMGRGYGPPPNMYDHGPMGPMGGYHMDPSMGYYPMAPMPYGSPGPAYPMHPMQMHAPYPHMPLGGGGRGRPPKPMNKPEPQQQQAMQQQQPQAQPQQQMAIQPVQQTLQQQQQPQQAVPPVPPAQQQQDYTGGLGINGGVGYGVPQQGYATGGGGQATAAPQWAGGGTDAYGRRY